MSVREPIGSLHQLARLLQIGVVLEEVVEARASKHRQTDEQLDPALDALLEDAIQQARTHRRRLESVIEDIEAESVAYEDIEPLVEAQYQADQDFDDIIYDQLCNAETAYKFFDDLLEALETTDATFSVDGDRLRSIVLELRDAEAAGVESVTDLMEAQS
ncbi:ferritin-like domain-containing protein [Halorhabdus rudnickae]|uniref:ferritin-like domain-containing protein n=1 Tax=Halorhabdus rudnickae TaxID=1775544 RepID=UPI001082C4A4|nr:ferritin-like domain-containing protein [Halorhabdus rudnickae]